MLSIFFQWDKNWQDKKNADTAEYASLYMLLINSKQNIIKLNNLKSIFAISVLSEGENCALNAAIESYMNS